MKKFTKITLIIAAVFAAVGIALCTVAATVAGGLGQIRTMARNGELNFGNWHFEDGVYYKGEDMLENIGGFELGVDLLAGGDEQEKNAYTQEIRNIEMDLDLANVVIKAIEQDNFTIEMKNGFTKHYTERVEGDTLVVTYDVGVNNYKDAPDITICIPKNCELETINVETDLGNVEIWDLVQGCEEIILSADMGNVAVYNSNISRYCNIQADMGNAQMTDVICKTAELHSDMGTVKFAGVIKEDLRLTTDMGSAEADIAGKETDYNIYLTADLGQVKCDGGHHSSHHGNKYECENVGAKGDIYMESSMGEVSLSFE